MKQIPLKGQLRKTGRKADVKTVRSEGRVPCNLYGNGMENVAFSVDAKDLRKITDTPDYYIIRLDIEGKEYLSVLQEVQWHSVTDEARHVDFLVVTEDKPVAINVPLKISGHAEGVKEGGRLITGMRELRCYGLIDDLPDLIEVDSTPVKMGKQILVGDLDIPKTQILAPKSQLVCAVRHTRQVVETTVAATPAAGEAVAGEGEAAAAGETAADEGKDAKESKNTKEK
ncbi:MAG: 50S ribosomal protein L25 [Bacteroidales bacterium]|jgi:large subunit ribosomal protein L25|nr:50S ribosomal protein L25 [Bacteroidales bacterium]MCI2121281.1 50S ribosomal protein L25 [Bacteroidales bacterium]MCI2145229.1 50S ribosomal protein L25 [Bacteroidales bacterium]